MKTEDWKKIKELVSEVLPLDKARRADYLRAANVSDEIRAEVESLAACQQEADDLMNLSAVEFSKEFFDGSQEDDSALVGQTIGVYKIVRELGQGGMGAVYLATRVDGKFKQKVALKMLKREMNTAALRRRFQHEREILASLEHPSIARLLDAGATGERVPYLVMEYVEGLPIDDYCALHQYDLIERLDLFRVVCSTVDFAHRNLIVHRDLKPSNILVNSDGIPKLLDFGISKILSAEFENASSATVTKLGVMTPSYASPEQLQSKSVTTATDIYSLGVILYELLSGHRPFENKENDLKEIYKAVLENQPPPPSALINTASKKIKTQSESPTVLLSEKASGSGDTDANKLQRTNAQTVKLNSQSLRGDLDNIVLKALRKEPERRYSSAENLAEDIHRHQRGLPVAARPNTFSYRAEKFIKRNRAGVFAAGLIALAVVVGVAATLWQWREARAERAKAERRFGDVRKLANSYLFDIFPEIEKLEGSLKARGKILTTALEYLDSLSGEAEGDTGLQTELATAYEKIGEVQGAVNITNLGDIKAGMESYGKAQKLRESVFAANRADAKNKEALSKNYQITAQTLMWNVDTARAAENFERAIALRRELVAEKPDSPDMQNRLAVILTDYAAIPITNVENEKAARLLDEAMLIIKETLKKNPEHFYTLKAYPRALRAYSHLKTNVGDYNGAIAAIDESVARTGELVKLKPEDYTLQRTVWLNDFHYCEVWLARGDAAKIVESCSKTIDFNVKALEKEPDESFALYDLAISRYDIAQGYRLANDAARSIEFARQALEPLAKLNKISPGVNEYERAVAVVENEIADSLLLLGKPNEALEYLRDAQSKLEKVVEADATVTSNKIELAKIYRSTARAFSAKNEKPKASEFAGKAAAIVGKLKETNRLRDADKNFSAELTGTPSS